MHVGVIGCGDPFGSGGQGNRRARLASSASYLQFFSFTGHGWPAGTRESAPSSMALGPPVHSAGLSELPLQLLHKS